MKTHPLIFVLFLWLLPLSVASFPTWTEARATQLFPNQEFPVGLGPVSIASGDFNNDGRADLAVANAQSQDVSVLLGAGEGTFLPEMRIQVGSTVRFLVTLDSDQDGNLDLAVGLESGNDLITFRGRGNGQFYGPGRLAIGGSPRSLAVGDFDSDGRPDLAFALSPDQVLIRLGNGAPGSTYSVGEDPVAVAVGDLNADSRPDLVVANNRANSISVLLGKGDGTFRPAFQRTAGNSSIWVALGDLNRDGKQDAVLANNTFDGYPHSGVTVLLGNGDGTFGPAAYFPAGSFPVAVEIADFNHDERDDLAVLNSSSRSLSILLGDGGGRFQEPISFATGYYPAAFALDDFNGDGLADLAITNVPAGDSWSLPGRVSVNLGHGRTLFGPQPILHGGPAPLGVAQGDFNGDGRADLAVGNNGGDEIFILLGGPGGSFAPGVGIELTPGLLNSVCVADFNRDGAEDLAVANEGVWGMRADSQISVLLGGGDGSFGPEILVGGPGSAYSITARDFNNDGLEDLIVGNREPYRPGTVSLFLGHGDGTFDAARSAVVGQGPFSIAVSDLNRDGNADVVTADYVSNDVSILLGNGSGGLIPAGKLFPRSGCRTVSVGDLDQDGKPDLAVAGGHDASVFLGNGNGTFRPLADYYGIGGESCSSALADFDGDGRPDLAVGNCESFDVSILRGTGGGMLAQDLIFTVGSHPQSLALGDYDANGWMDLAVATYSGVVLMLNQSGPADTDDDGIPDSRDPCTDMDGDGFGDPGFPANACPADNCPFTANALQEDADRDGRGDSCDWCTLDPVNDTDQDRICEGADNCPGLFNPGQQDADGDGRGDVCDPCPQDPREDADGDRVCPDVDNCPDTYNPLQADRDQDGAGDACDTCPGDAFNDADRDGRCGDEDNCPGSSNADQRDADGDGEGDVCDPCPLDALNDSDHDGACADADNCPFHSNPGQEDQDEDGKGDVCDNCPAAANPAQEDVNGDGSGDACQPVVILSSFRPGPGGSLEASLLAGDPQNDVLSGSLEFLTTEVEEFSLPDIMLDYDCSLGLSPDGIPGEGIGFVFGSLGSPYLLDLDSALGCLDWLQDFEMAAGTCASPSMGFDSYLDLAPVSLPAPVCIRRVGSGEGGFDLVIQDFDSQVLHASTTKERVSALRVPFSSGLPRQVALSSLRAGAQYLLVVTVTDGTTVPVVVQGSFVYGGEPVMLINTPPEAHIAAPDSVECTSPLGGQVLLDGSGSQDPDSHSGTHDDIVSFEWFRSPRPGSEVLLGTGETLMVDLPPGANEITLVVTDSVGDTASSHSRISVVDTVPPILVCPQPVPAECASPEGAVVSVEASATDACTGAVPVSNDRTPGGGDASGSYPLGTTEVMFRTIDAEGHESNCISTVMVQDTTPPGIQLAVTPSVLWPPNHRMLEVTTSITSEDACGPATVVLSSIVSSEPDDAQGLGDGGTLGDVQGAQVGFADDHFMLRAERDGSGEGRAYRVTYSAVDASGNEARATSIVLVPHDQDGGADPLVVSVAENQGGTVLAWPPVTRAGSYRVVRGIVGSLREAGDFIDLGTVTCARRDSAATDTRDHEDAEVPPSGEAFFYLVAYSDGRDSGYGTDTATKPRVKSAGGCE